MGLRGDNVLIPLKPINIKKGWLYYYWYMGRIETEFFEDRKTLESVIDNHLSHAFSARPALVINLETGEVYQGKKEIDDEF